MKIHLVAKETVDADFITKQIVSFKSEEFGFSEGKQQIFDGFVIDLRSY